MVGVQEEEETMPAAKFLVLYPRPKDIEKFEKLYQSEHVPMADEKLAGKTKFVATKVLGSPAGTPPFYRVAEIISHRCRPWRRVRLPKAESQTLAHARSISTGGEPIFLIAEEETFNFAQTASA